MRKTSIAPSFCAACFQQKPDKVHVDFEAAFDGPVVEVSPGIKVTIDDLVICRDCLAAAASLIGYVHDEELKSENEELGRTIDRLLDEAQYKDKSIVDLTKDVANLGRANVKKRHGKPPPVYNDGVKVEESPKDLRKRRISIAAGEN